jgi:signal peptidase II
MLSRKVALLIAAAVFLLDRVTKLWIESTMDSWDVVHVIPGFFDLVHTKNRGAAFGIFADSDHPLRTTLLIVVSVAVLVFITVVLLRPSKGNAFGGTKLTGLGLALVMGGALGNIYDRAVFGEVTDFLEFYYESWRFAAFNIADSAITVGAGLLLLDMWRTRKETDVSEAH